MSRKKFFEIAGFLPLFLFVDIYLIFGDWEKAFILGGITALLQIILCLSNKVALERFMLAINLFLIGGAIGLGFHITLIENFYDYFMETTLFIFLLCIGIITTLFSKKGFTETSDVDLKSIQKKSLLLVFATACATIISYYFKGNILLSAVIPFCGLIFARQLLTLRK